MGTYKINIDTIFEDAVTRLGEPITEDDLEWESWGESWGSTALGFGGIGGQAITKAQTTVVLNIYNDVVLVYLGNRFWKVFDRDSPRFQKCFSARRFSR